MSAVYSRRHFTLTAVQGLLLLVPGMAWGQGMLLTFQEGVNGYAGTVDTFLQQANPGTSYATSVSIEWDGEDLGGSNFLLLRFDNIFGTGPGLIAPGDVITSATLTYDVINVGNSGTVNEVAVPWAETDTYNSFGGDAGVQADEYGAVVGSAAGTPLGSQTLDVTSSIAAWKSNPAANRGWIFRPTGVDGVEIRSREDAAASLRPKLSVVINGGAPASKTLTVKHQPYLQLGDAPLAATGPGIGLTDQIVIVWQTVESGTGTAPDDFFEVQYRKAGEPVFVPAGPISTLNTGVGTRVNHSVLFAGLDYNTLYDYQVTHKRTPAAPVVVNTYNGAFRTRRPPGDDGTYLFAAHGDSATLYNSNELAQFESVNARIAAASAEFVTLLGDNVYDNGTHDEFDARLDATRAPNNSAYIRNHVEYFCNGNHDSGGATYGIPSLQNYYCPMPVLGVTSPVAPPAGETPEFNYSFDYGLVHFATIDSTAWGGVNGGTAGFISPTRQANILNWLAADMAASSLPWKVVMTHHPPKSIAGHTDTGEGMAAELIPVLVQQNVDLLLVGHSHNYQRSFPLTGYAAGNVTFDMDQSGTYTKGSRVIQVVAGTGGRNIDGTVPTTASGWLAKAYGINNGGKVGPLLVTVSRQQLLVRFTAADTGAIMDEFRVVLPGPLIALDKSSVSPTAWLGDPMPSDSFTISNGGAETLNYTITEDVPWLAVTPTGGSSTGEADSVQIDYDVTGMTAGSYTGQITVSSPDASNSPKVLTVNLIIQTVKPDFDGDGDVDQSDFGHLQVCLTGSGATSSGAECQNARLDSDSDVDSVDIGLFRLCLAGPNVFPSRTCMQ